MSEEHELSEEELEQEDAEEVPAREAMSIVPLPGEELGSPNVGPLKGGEQL